MGESSVWRIVLPSLIALQRERLLDLPIGSITPAAVWSRDEIGFVFSPPNTLVVFRARKDRMKVSELNEN